MTTQITQGIKISIKTFPLDANPLSNPFGAQPEKYFFSYRIKIENLSRDTVQLLKRHWEIFDSSCDYKEVSGDGVVGAKPVLKPGDVYEYESFCGFVTEIGKMKGSYLMERKSDGKLFTVSVPVFEMYMPFRMN